MSNPGVLYLAEKRLSSLDSFRVEDNIGEAIHLHLGEMRLDLTIADFLRVADICEQCINALTPVEGFDARRFDPFFLDMISADLVDLEHISHDVVWLSQLKVQTKGLFGLPVVQPLSQSRVMKTLQGNSAEDRAYRQENLHGVDNVQRTEAILRSIAANGYPFQEQYIVLFNDQNNIRDGQHRASCLYHLHGDAEIPVIRMHFKDGKHGVSQHPWLHELGGAPLKKALRFLLRALRRIVHQILK